MTLPVWLALAPLSIFTVLIAVRLSASPVSWRLSDRKRRVVRGSALIVAACWIALGALAAWDLLTR